MPSQLKPCSNNEKRSDSKWSESKWIFWSNDRFLFGATVWFYFFFHFHLSLDRFAYRRRQNEFPIIGYGRESFFNWILVNHGNHSLLSCLVRKSSIVVCVCVWHVAYWSQSEKVETSLLLPNRNCVLLGFPYHQTGPLPPCNEQLSPSFARSFPSIVRYLLKS